MYHTVSYVNFLMLMIVLWLCRRMSLFAGNTYECVVGQQVSKSLSSSSGRKKVLEKKFFCKFEICFWGKKSNFCLDIRWVPKGCNESLVMGIY